LDRGVEYLIGQAEETSQHLAGEGRFTHTGRAGEDERLTLRPDHLIVVCAPYGGYLGGRVEDEGPAVEHRLGQREPGLLLLVPLLGIGDDVHHQRITPRSARVRRSASARSCCPRRSHRSAKDAVLASIDPSPAARASRASCSARAAS